MSSAGKTEGLVDWLCLHHGLAGLQSTSAYEHTRETSGLCLSPC